MLTGRRAVDGRRWLDRGAMLLGFAAGLAGYTLGFEAIARGGVRQGIPAPVFFLFGTVGLLAAIGDLRMIRSGGLRGAPRLTRHLWRMCFALWIGAASFFLVPARVPELIRDPVLRTIPVLVPIVAMLYWLWRMRTRWAIKEQTS
jgi:hypothetical protein